MIKFDKSRFFWIPIVFSIGIWLVTIIQMPIYDYSADPFWYMKNLPFLYWIGLGVVLFAVFFRLTKIRKTKLSFDICLIFLLVLYIFGTLSVKTANPPFLDTYSHFAEIKLVETSGVVPLVPKTPHLDTPGAYIFFASLRIIIGQSIFDSFIVPYYPVFLVFFVSMLTYVLAQRSSANRHSLVAALVFLSFAFFLEFQMSRQSFSLIFLCLLFISTSVIIKSKSTPWIVIFLISFLMAVVSHPLVPLIFLIGLTSYFVLGNFAAFGIRINRPHPVLIGLILFGFIAYLSWSNYYLTAAPWFVNRVEFVKSAFANIQDANLNLMPELLLKPSQIFADVVNLRIAFYVVEIGLSFLTVLFLWFTNAKKGYFVLAGYTVGFVIVELFFFFGYGYLGRTFLYTLFPLTILCALSFESILKRRKRIVMFLVLLIAMSTTSMVFIPVTGYGGNLPFECPSTSELSVINFIHSAELNGSRLTGLHHGGILESEEYSKALTFYPIVPIEGVDLTSQIYAGVDVISLNIEYNFYKLRFGSDNIYSIFEENVSRNYSKVYDSGSGRMYKANG